MTQSPKKYVSNFTSSTTNRGVEAKEIEIANTHLDINASESTQYQETSADIDIRSQASGDTGSYLQVVVQKHRKRDPVIVGTQTSPRLPVASSPIKGIKSGAGDTQVYLLQQPMLLAYPPNPQNVPNVEKPELRKKLSTVKEETLTIKQSFWSKFEDITKDTSPDRIEMYYFERTTGDYLTADGTFTYTEKFAFKVSRVANRIVAECFAVPQIVLSIPVSIFLHTERMVLRVFRSILVGTVQGVSDYVLKPVLTLAFNSVIQPPLVFLGNVVKAIREAVRPFAEMMGDFVQPLVKVLSAVRLVNVEKGGCSHV